MKNVIKSIALVIMTAISVLYSQASPCVAHDTPIPSVVQALSEGKRIKIDEKIAMFIQDCERDSVYNQNVPQHTPNPDILRVMTYNIHFWMDPYFKGFRNHPDRQPIHTQMLTIIKKINPDVLVLQEVTLDGNKFNPQRKNYKEELETALAKIGYDYLIWQPLKPTKGPYVFGNLIASKLPLTSNMHIYTIDENNEEQRGYINVNVAGVSLYGTHLDVWDETEQRRICEMRELIAAMDSDENPNVLLLGDLNAVRKQDHNYEVNGKNAWDILVSDDRERLKFDTPTKTLEILTENYVDAFEYSNTPAPKYTVWSGKKVDFIMLKKCWNLPIIGCYPWYDGTSDHIPLIIDIKRLNQKDKSMLKAISHVTMLVNDLDETVNFYQKLGFDIHTDANFEGMRWLTLCLPERKDFELVVLQAKSDAEKALVGKQAGNHPFITLESSDCHKDYESLQAQGVKTLGTPEKQPWGTAFALKDNSGNMVYICQHA